MNQSVIVVGGGLAGLVAGYRLQQAGHDVQVLEADESVGGWAQSLTQDGFGLERGPHSYRGQSPTLHALASELEIPLCTPEDAGIRWIGRGGQRFQLPRSPLGLIFSPLLSIAGRLRLLTEPFRQKGHDPEESVSHFFRRRIGAEAAQVLIGSMVGGIHATHPDRLGIADAFPQLWQMEQQHGSLFRGMLAMRRERKGQTSGLYAPMDGMGAFGQALAQRLGDAVQTGARVVGLTRHAHRWRVHMDDQTMEADHVVLATPVHVTAALLETVAPETAQLLAQVESSSLALVHRYGLIGGDSVPSGFGVLFAPEDGRQTLGILFGSRQFPHRIPNPEAWSLVSFHPIEVRSSQEPSFWEDLATSQAAERLDFSHVAIGSRVELLHRAIPVLAPGHLKRMRAAAALLKNAPGLTLAGSYLLGVSLECAVQSGEQAASEMLNSMPALMKVS